MKSIRILDCTLRDGAQVNEARFGEAAIADIVKSLRDAKIDMIECGFLKESAFEPGRTYFRQPSDARRYIPADKQGLTYTALVDFWRYDVEQLEEYDGSSFDLIRISLFEKDIDKVGAYCKRVREKGYRFSIQPMATYSYTPENLRRILEVANEVQPEMLPIVDTYSIADTDAVGRVYEIYERYLDPKIRIGFHSHNNQLNSFALARKFMEISAPERDIVVDCSLYGMGRGGGNLNTELFSEYLNAQGLKNYRMKPILDMIDQYLTEFKKQYEWGYSLPMLYAGLYGVHVHTVAYLENKPSVTSYDLRCMFSMLDEYKKKRYDYDYLDEVYEAYMAKKVSSDEKNSGDDSDKA